MREFKPCPCGSGAMKLWGLLDDKKAKKKNQKKNQNTKKKNTPLATHCFQCKPTEAHYTAAMIDLGVKLWYGKPQKAPLLKKYGNQCTRCYCASNPGSTKPKRFKLKEDYVNTFLETKFPHLTFVRDQTLPGACSARRPDWLYETSQFQLILECDERQHRGYTCEAKRKEELWGDSGCGQVIMVRFNPDQYTDSTGTKHRGCFKRNDSQTGEDIQDRGEWKRRTNLLYHTLSTLLEPSFDPSTRDLQPLHEIHLFYDGFVSTTKYVI
ncbi:uncharacterized protein BJ171DRAFT_636770 [Polychytrium aggregatum]|uniref:uncharacterized protein n=1 Tax=Polychytrium aggregatum TaxID=110093 RepID=UPI0022FDD7BA|nr:uncharacterized protein BJ171DRAFT_636770 [Polychytrium aggregatum]KAI9193449.1 hypothetical protein BJ171DRAFT_636770 [Polychytrium aggregatum]